MVVSERPKIFLAVPTYNDLIHWTTAAGVAHAVERHEVLVAYTASSLLAYGFNRAWVDCHNRKNDQAITHFGMLHADIGPIDRNWMGILLEEMQRREAKVICAVSPIKNASGDTSVGIDQSARGGRSAHRFSFDELVKMPETFTVEDVGREGDILLLNTGMMLVDLRGDWCDPSECFFAITDQVLRRADGRYDCKVISEDWHFSRCCHRAGARTAVTKRVALNHYGTVPFSTSALAEGAKRT